MLIDLKDLFERDNVKCPNFLSKEKVMTELFTSEYSFKDGVHYWRYDDDFRHLELSFDGITYLYLGFDDDGNEIYRKELSEGESFIT